MKKLLVIIGNENGGEGSYQLVNPENGEVLGGHYCSHIGYAMGDLWANRKERQQKVMSDLGVEEIEVKHLKDTDITFEQLQEKNEAWAKQNKEALA